MLIQRLLLSLLLAIASISLSSPGDAASSPDTRLVLKNGAEVRGVFVELRDDQYTLRLPDGRLMKYATADVERMERLQPGSGASSDPSSPAAAAQPAFDPSSCRVFVTEANLDKSLYTTIKDIKVSKKSYGSTAEVFGQLAERARKVNADAVINVSTWYSPSGFAWAAPHAGGMAVKLTEAGRKALPSLEGRCY